MAREPTRGEVARARGLTMILGQSEPIDAPIKGVGQWAEWGTPAVHATSRPPSPPLRRKRGRPTVLQAVRPSAALRARYQRLLLDLVGEMHADVKSTIEGAYAASGAAQDAPPAVYLQGVMRRLGLKWGRRLDTASQELAAYFAKAAKDRADGQLEAILKRAGISVPFRLTPAVRDALEASVAENVSLIKSIGSQYLTAVEGHVMRSVTVGRDLAPLARSLEHQFGVTRRRAALIARDQNNKATAVITRERQNELGIRAVWLHSAGGKTPRPSHVANSGKEYDPKEGWFDPDVGERIWPGTLINCRCVSKSVIPGLS